jgi:hypothetical protein
MKSKLVTIAAAFSAVGGLLGSASAATITIPSNSVIGVSLQNGAIVVSTADDIPEYETASNAFDDNPDTKYLNFQKYNTGVIITPFTEFSITGVEFVTANDAPERNPTSFSIYGSSVAGSTTFSAYTPVILNQAISAFSEFSEPYESSGLISVNSSSAFASYLIVFPTIVDYNSFSDENANSMQIGEISLQGNSTSAVPEPSTSLLLALGAGGLLTRRRTTRKA